MDRLTIDGEVMVDQVVEFIKKMENLNDKKKRNGRGFMKMQIFQQTKRTK